MGVSWGGVRVEFGSVKRGGGKVRETDDGRGRRRGRGIFGVGWC